MIGAISRMSPPLVLAMCLAFLMFAATYVVGIYEPVKLLGGFGVIGLFGAGLLAAPALLRVQGEAIEPVWLHRWYPGQRRFMIELRPVVSRVHQIVVVAQVALLAVALGAMTSGSYRAWVTSARLMIAALATAMCGFVLARVLWVWAPRPSGEGPICTEVLTAREPKLMMLAGWALVFGSVFSLTAILVA